MSRYAQAHPEDYESRLEATVDEADTLRKERKEWPEFCPACGRPRTACKRCGEATCTTYCGRCALALAVQWGVAP